MNTQIHHNAPASYPKSVFISGVEYPLYYTIYPRYTACWAFVLVDGVPIISVNLFGDMIYRHSIERAERVVKAYLDNNKKWLPHPPTAFGMFDNVGLDDPSPYGFYDEYMLDFNIDFIDDPSVSVEVYETRVKSIQNDKHHTDTFHTLSILYNGDTRFSIIDKSLQKEVILRYNKRVHPTRRIMKETHGIDVN